MEVDAELQELIKKLYDKKCTPQELEKLFQSLASMSHKQAQRVMKELWDQVKNYPELEEELSGKMYGNILSTLEKQGAPIGSKDAKIRKLAKRRRQLLSLSTAAVVLILMGITGWFWTRSSHETILTTEYAEQQTHTLPDGSTVVLNANSTLRYEQNWGASRDRIIWLEGEAFFAVEKKPVSGQKFKVITGDLTVEVLGTSFNVNSRHAQTRVYLEEGKIALALKHQEGQTMMEPGDLVSYSAADQRIITSNKKESQNLHTSWKNGVLVFDDTPLRDVLLKIEEMYGIEIKLKDETHYDRPITTGLPVKELKIVLPMLARAMNLNIVKEGDLYIIQ